jgi:hypothetical protein
MPYGDHLAISPCKVEPQLVSLQVAVENLIRAIRATEKASKALLEAEKDLNMFTMKGHGQAEMGARRDWLERVYVPRLRQIGLTRQELARRLGQSFRVTDHAITTSWGAKLFDLYEGEDAFELVMPTEALERRIFCKKGDLQQGTVGVVKHYVKDDIGQFTRRYAYVEKPWDVFKILLVKSELIGKDVVTKLGGDPYSKGNFAKAKYNFPQTGDQGKMSIRELAFVNQEDGSTTQRGLALSSTAKGLHGNQGFRFGNHEGVCLKIDLALIANETNNLLLNLHSFDAQKETIGLETYNLKGAKRTKHKATAADSKLHTDGSTSKNREVVALRLPLYAIRTVYFHNQISESVFSDFVKQCIAETGATHTVDTVYSPHAAASDDELFET